MSPRVDAAQPLSDPCHNDRHRRGRRRPSTCPSPAPARERGSASVELVVLFPTLLALIFIVVQAGLHYYARSVALAAAQEGARAAAVQGATAAAGSQAASAFVDTAGAELLVGPQVIASRTAQTATVVVTGTSISLVPGYDGFPIRQQASVPVEEVS